MDTLLAVNALPAANTLPAVSTLLVVLDLAGTFVFALSGALAGVRHRLDLFGVLALAFVAGNAGGITRDVLLGATPPPAIADWRYIVVSFAAGLLTFRWQRLVARLRSPVLALDAAGLALFAVAGAQKALAFHLNPLAAALLGALTGVGGGMLRDVLVAEVPTVLTAEVYAVAALAGAAVVVAGGLLRLPAVPVAAAGAALCFGLRLGALRRGWDLPRARPPADADQRDPRER
ncbi:MAG TPA: TRIC cation channel family protein [Thermomicrobiales bacterium]|nr:TRIC cation channel family protein [Thermomicrobiales bacterium]